MEASLFAYVNAEYLFAYVYAGNVVRAVRVPRPRVRTNLPPLSKEKKRKDLVKNKIFSLWKAAITYPPGSNLQVLSA